MGHDWTLDPRCETFHVPLWNCSRCGKAYSSHEKPSPDVTFHHVRGSFAIYTCEEIIAMIVQNA